MEVGIILGTIYIGYFVIDYLRNKRFYKKWEQKTKETKINDNAKEQIQKSYINELGYIPFKESGYTNYKKWYHECYLFSPHWKNTKTRIIKIADRKCQLCGERKELRVHHNNYDNLGHEHTSDLIALCNDCHNLYHDSKKSSR